jgi:hypothetical protein
VAKFISDWRCHFNESPARRAQEPESEFNSLFFRQWNWCRSADAVRGLPMTTGARNEPHLYSRRDRWAGLMDLPALKWIAYVGLAALIAAASFGALGTGAI